ncbi:MAG: N-acetylmuramoyl-L-alanine amidase [Bryobacteraceae bacterium]|nr:N-acetylmuramoyl-L-alanine amidase [Bryobacteraceae bacterium]
MSAWMEIRLGVALLVGGALLAQPVPENTLTAVRFWTFSDLTRIVIETSEDFQFRKDRVPDPDRLFFDLTNTVLRLGKRGQVTYPVNDSRLRQIRLAETVPGTSRVVFDLQQDVDFSVSVMTNPPRLLVELRRGDSKAGKGVTPPVISAIPTSPAVAVTSPASLPPPPVRQIAEPSMVGSIPALPKQAIVAINPPVAGKRSPLPPPPRAANMGAQSMTRALGLKIGRIVLDPGHGGHDTGTSGVGGLLEKDLVLDVCKRLGALVETRLGAEVVYTRTDDTYIPLDRRTDIANQQRADLFLSIHANSSPAGATSGVETYYLNFTDNKTAMELAARENAGSSKTVYDLKELLQKIAMHDKIEESRQFAARVHQSLYTASAKANQRTRDRGVKKAPFVVLIGASMPSVLAEIGFVTNPKDEALFRKADFRQKIADGLFQGISRYAGTLSQFQVAQK